MDKGEDNQTYSGNATTVVEGGTITTAGHTDDNASEMAPPLPPLPPEVTLNICYHSVFNLYRKLPDI